MTKGGNAMEYSKMTKAEIIEFLSRMKSEADEGMDRISEIKNLTGSAYKEKLQDIRDRYAKLKELATEAYQYTQLLINHNESNLDYTRFFVPSVQDIYVHCNAKINSSNLTNLFDSLYDISDYAGYYLSQM